MLGDRVLVIGAHPDDDILGCGGVMAKLRKRGAAVKVVFVGEGSSCRFGAADLNGRECLTAIFERREMARKSLSRVGVNEITFLEAVCGRFDMTPLIDIGKSIEAEIAAFQPDTVFTHSHADANNDHRITFQATLQATRPSTTNRVATVLSYEVLSSTEWRFIESFLPNYFVSIENEIDTKISAMSVYTTEVRPYPFARSLDSIRALAMLRGSQVGVSHAEAFHIVRGIQT